ncbi:mitochondrial carrier domain-containing protein [Phlyctochytrium arcticum]|nr:mitochondrial carrier domain-containing protein [Phlyctochytrium arcticum]
MNDNTTSTPVATTRSRGNNKNAGLKSFLSGGFGGISMVSVSHPFDLVKVLMQTSAKQESGTFSAMRSIMRIHGIKGLYKGVAPVMLGSPPVLATCLWSYHIGQLLVKDLDPPIRSLATSADLIDTLTFKQIGLAGAFSAIPTSLILGPAEQIKIRLQVMKENGSARAVIKDIVKEGGIRALFRGTGLTMARDVPGSFFYFMSYEKVKRSLSTDIGASLNPATILLAGGLAGMVNWTVAIPIDTVKSRFQSQNPPIPLAECVRQIAREGGVPALFRGLGPTLIRAFPASAAFFLGVEGSKSLLNHIL